MQMCEAGYPKNWLNWGVSGVEIINKYPLNFIKLKTLACEPHKINCLASHERILKLKKKIEVPIDLFNTAYFW